MTTICKIIENTISDIAKVNIIDRWLLYRGDRYNRFDRITFLVIYLLEMYIANLFTTIHFNKHILHFTNDMVFPK